MTGRHPFFSIHRGHHKVAPRRSTLLGPRGTRLNPQDSRGAALANSTMHEEFDMYEKDSLLMSLARKRLLNCSV